MLAVLRNREGGLRRGENFWLRLTTASAQCLRLSGRFFHITRNGHQDSERRRQKWITLHDKLEV